MSSAEIVKSKLGSVRFVATELESAYIRHALQKSVADGKHTPLIAAVLFALSAPMDIALIGNGELSAIVLHCLAVKAVWILFLIVSSIAQDAIGETAKSIVLILGWFGSVFVIWYVAALAPGDMTKFYILQFGLASLSTITLLPVLAHWQVPAMNLCLISPAAERAWHALPGQPSTEVWQFLCMAFLLGAVCMFTVVSKRSYEYALREDFARRLELADARDAALAADDAKTAFLSAVSHDMRTPLNAILGNIQLLQRTQMPQSQKKQTLDDAETASRTLLSLVESVLHSASGEVKALRTEDVRLIDLLGEVRANIEIIAGQKGLTFEARLSGDPGLLRIDKQKLVQVFLNLLTNSTKFTQEGVVGLRLRSVEEKLHFFIHDTGPGMPAEDAKRAFDPFFKSSGSSRPFGAGFGLGLAITRDIVSGLGGSIRLRSRLGRGTFVSGWFPVERPQVSLSDLRGPTNERPDACLSILIIEDEALNIAVLKRMLDSLGQTYTFAETGATGIEAYAQGNYDCVFVDIRLPDMSGIDVLSALATCKTPIHVPKFAVTANVLSEDLKSYKEAGFEQVIAKPVDLDVLTDVLNTVAVDRRKAPLTPQRITEHWIDVQNDYALRAIYVETALECSKHIQNAIERDEPVLVAKMAHRIRGAALFARDTATVLLAESVEYAAQVPLIDWRDQSRVLVARLQEIAL